MALQQRQPQFTPSRFFNPDEDFVPAPAPADPSAPAPQPSAAAAGSPQPAPAGSAPSLAPGVDPMSSAEAFHAPSQDDYIRANTPARPIGPYDKIPAGQPGADSWGNRHNRLRQGLASIFAGLAETGGEMNGHPGLGARMLEDQADTAKQQRTYDANQGRIPAAAKIAAAGEQLGQAATAATTAHTQAETNIIGQNLPAQELAQKAYDKLRDAWINKSTPDFDKFAQSELSAMPANISRMVRPHLQEIKGLQQTGKGYSITMQDDLPKSVNVYGKEYERTDPQLEQLAPGAGAEFDRNMAAHTTKRGEKLQDEKTVAGYAADRQTQGFVHADQAASRQFTRQQQEKGQAEAAKHLQSMREAENQNQLVQQLASSKSPTDQTSLAFKALGLDLPDGVHRINETELNAIRNQGSLSDRAYRALLNWNSGQQFAPGILKDISQTANKIAQSKIKNANDNLEDVNRNYGYRVNGADDRGRFDAQQQSSGAHVIEVNGKRYQYKGSGDTADMNNYTPI